MKKNKLFTFLSIITLILIFGVAATCNLCGAPVTIGETGETEDLEDKEKTDKHDTDEDRTDSAQSTGDEEQ